VKLQLGAKTQEEFDEKRPELIKAIAGKKYDVAIKKKGQKTSLSPRAPYFKAQEQMLRYWDQKFQAALKEIKREVLEIIKE
jgi:hypothetical protein